MNPPQNQPPSLLPLSQFAYAPILVLITAMLMMQPLSTDLYLASLPTLATDFSVPVATVQLTLSLFVVGFGGAQLVVGPLSDRFGRRPVVLGGLALYLLASILCGLSRSIELLIAARFLQALGCCAAVMVARAIVRDAYAPEHSARVIARASTWISLAPIFGPILGSYLQVSFGWRAAFIALGIFSTLLFIVCILRLPETNEHKNPEATRLAGLLDNYRRVLGSREFWTYAFPGAISYSSIFMFISGSSFVLIQVLEVQTQWFGYCFAIGVSGYMTGTLICRRLLKSFSSADALRIGTTCSLGAGVFFLIATIAGLWHWSTVVIAMFLTMAAHGINFPVTQSGAVAPFARQAGTAAGLMGALFMACAFVTGTVVGATHNGTLYPLAIIACALGALNFFAVRWIAPRTVRA
jgi:DHA1 family bicyclomycin/chloramphenicol resistance-like MFS transporter